MSTTSPDANQSEDPLASAMGSFHETLSDSHMDEEMASDQKHIERMLTKNFLAKDAPTFQQGLQIGELIPSNFLERLFKRGSVSEFPVVVVNRSAHDCVLSVCDSANSMFRITSEQSFSGSGGPTSASGAFSSKSSHVVADRVNGAMVKPLKGSDPKRIPTYTVFYIPSSTDMLYLTVGVLKPGSAGSAPAMYDVIVFRERVAKGNWFLIDEPIIPLATLPLQQLIEESVQIVKMGERWVPASSSQQRP